MNLVVIYEAAFNTVDAVLDYLRKQGYDAVALEHPYSDVPRMTDPSRHTLRDFISPLTYVAVPPDQEIDARRAIGEFHLPSQKRFAAKCETLLFALFDTLIKCCDHIIRIFFIIGNAENIEYRTHIFDFFVFLDDRCNFYINE